MIRYVPRECTVARMAAEGLTQRQVAEIIGVTPQTIWNEAKRFNIIFKNSPKARKGN